MANCPHCGLMNEEGVMTCVHCGKPMTKDETPDMGGESSEDSGSM